MYKVRPIIIHRPYTTQDELRVLTGFISTYLIPVVVQLNEDSPGAVADPIYAVANGIDDDFIQRLKECPPSEQNLVIAFGGDGTFATASRLAIKIDGIVAGIQAGNVNFLNAFKSSDINKILQLSPGNLKSSRRSTGESSSGDLFINDVVFKAAKGMGTFTIRDTQDRYMMSFRGDGVVVSTAMGSTAYNLSLGGPILHPTAEMFVITPMAPMSMAARPLVVPIQNLTVSIENGFLNAEFDGLGNYIEESGKIGIKGGKSVHVLLPNEYNFYDQAREKLGWYK